jgi:hypothetical protein
MVNAGIAPLNATFINQALKFPPHFPKKSKNMQNEEKKNIFVDKVTFPSGIEISPVQRHYTIERS